MKQARKKMEKLPQGWGREGLREEGRREGWGGGGSVCRGQGQGWSTRKGKGVLVGVFAVQFGLIFR